MIIARNGTPVARLLTIASRLLARRPGLWRAQVQIGADFDAPLPSDAAAGFGLDG